MATHTHSKTSSEQIEMAIAKVLKSHFVITNNQLGPAIRWRLVLVLLKLYLLKLYYHDLHSVKV